MTHDWCSANCCCEAKAGGRKRGTWHLICSKVTPTFGRFHPDGTVCWKRSRELRCKFQTAAFFLLIQFWLPSHGREGCWSFPMLQWIYTCIAKSWWSCHDLHVSNSISTTCLTFWSKSENDKNKCYPMNKWDMNRTIFMYSVHTKYTIHALHKQYTYTIQYIQGC